MTDINKVIVQNYMPYAMGTIIARAIPAIDGFKPVNRRIIYTMYKLGLQKNLSKCANIVGAVMKFHPHGDSSIYDALVRMSTGNGALNMPYIQSKGNFGKVFSRDMQYAAYRYTEARLAEVCKEMFEGIDENAVEFKPNYDNTEVEPELLPVKFPNILVNGSNGIAVAMSSSVPSYGLREVCAATIGIINGSIKDTMELVEALGAPEFSTGGYIHGDSIDYEALTRTGRGSVLTSSNVEIQRDKIVVREIPYRTTVESIKKDILDAVKNGEIKDIADVRDETDINGLRLTIELKRGADVKKVIKKINRCSDMVMKISFITRVIIDGRPRELGLMELLEEWIKYRIGTLERVYKYRVNKKITEMHLLQAWEKIADNVRDVAYAVASSNEEEAKNWMESKFRLDQEQIQYLMDMRVRDLTQNRLAKKLNELDSVRKDIELLNKIIGSEDMKKKIIVSELEGISNKYGSDRRTKMAPAVNMEKEGKIEEQIDDIGVSVIITEKGYIKRLITLRDEENLRMHDGDKIRFRINCNNRDTIIILTYGGMGYKLPVHSIEVGRGLPRDMVSSIISEISNDDIMYSTNAGDYTGSINIVGWHGRGVKLRFDRLIGPRSKYKNLFEGGAKGSVWYTESDKFFVITRRRRAAYVDLTSMGIMGNRVSFRAARVLSDDEIFGIQPLDNAPDKDRMDLGKYSRGYCVKIKDALW